jgi:hypothetical protein
MFVKDLNMELTPRQLEIYEGRSGLPEWKRQAYIALWKGEPARKSLPASTLVPDCPHLGEDTGEKTPCASCGGGVNLKVFRCGVYGRAVLGDRRPKDDYIQSCGGCPHNPKNQTGRVSVPLPPSVVLSPQSSLAVVTVVVGEEAEALHRVSGPTQRAFAKRIGADYHVSRWPGNPAWPMSSKYGILSFVPHYRRVLHLDADVVTPPGAVNPFDLCGEDEFGAVDELPFSRTQPQYGQEARYVKFRRTHGFPALPAVPWYFNAGVMVIPRASAHVVAVPPFPVVPDHCSEQDHTNAVIHDGVAAGRVKVRLMDRRANWQNWTDVGFAAAPADAIRHFSGGGEMRKRRLADMADFVSGVGHG